MVLDISQRFSRSKLCSNQIVRFFREIVTWMQARNYGELNIYDGHELETPVSFLRLNCEFFQNSCVEDRT